MSMDKLAGLVREETGVVLQGMRWEDATNVLVKVIQAQRERNALFKEALVRLSCELGKLTAYTAIELGPPERQCAVLQSLMRAELVRFDQQLSTVSGGAGVVGQCPPPGFR